MPRADGRRRARWKVRRQAGAPSIRVQVPRYDGGEPYVEVRDDGAQRVRERSPSSRRDSESRALVETHMQTILPSAERGVGLLQPLRPGHIGVIHDAGNMVYEGSSTTAWGSKCSARISPTCT